MSKEQAIYNLEGIEFEVIYSKRRSIGISVLPDSSVKVRVPYRTSINTVNRIVKEKASWIIRHRDNYIAGKDSLNRVFADGEKHLFRGNESVLKIGISKKPRVRFYDGVIELGLEKTNDQQVVKKLLYTGYKNEATTLFPVLLNKALMDYQPEAFKPAGLRIRTMKRRLGSCSYKGVITLSTELIKLPDIFIEYVIIHELCHLKHHNHGADYYKLLTQLFPQWKSVRKEMKKYIQA